MEKLPTTRAIKRTLKRTHIACCPLLIKIPSSKLEYDLYVKKEM